MSDASELPANKSPASSTIVIIGGGVIGSACADALAQAGADVTIVERNTIGSGCSHGNCGFVSPSHLLPLCRPGAVWSTLKTMFQRNSAFSISLRFDPALWNWLLRFAWNCNQRHMLSAGRARQALLNSSRQLYESMMSNNQLAGCEWHPHGLMFVHNSAKEFEHYATVDKMLRDEFGLGATPYEGEKLNEFEPALKSGFPGGWLYECDAHLRPDRLMAAWKVRLKSLGIRIIEQCEFRSLVKSNQHVTAIETSTGTISADQVVVASGAWSPLLAREFNTYLPIQPGKGYSLTMPRPRICPQYPLIFEQHHVAVTPMDTGYRIGSTMEFSGYDHRIRESRLQLLINGASHYLREPLAEPVQEKWMGWRPMSADGVPMIGRVPKLKNLWVASGHSMLGVSMAPATGKLMAELVTGETPHVDPHPLVKADDWLCAGETPHLIMR